MTTTREQLAEERRQAERVELVRALTVDADTYQDADAERLAESRYLMHEVSVTDGRSWYTPADDPLDLAAYSDDQEYAADWRIEWIADLDTGETVEVERRYVITGRTPDLMARVMGGTDA